MHEAVVSQLAGALFAQNWTDLKRHEADETGTKFENGIRVQTAGCAKQCEACALWEELPD